MQLFAFDFETFLIQPYLLAPPVVCMSYAVDDEDAVLLHRLDSRFRKMLLLALTTPGCIMVGHNVAFECAVIMANFPELTDALFAKLDAGEVYCTMQGEKLISIGKGDHWKEFGLDDCLARHTETKHLVVDKQSYWRLRYGLLATTPCELWPEEAYDYAITDAEVTRQLYRAQVKNGFKYIHDCTARIERTPRGGHEVFVPGQTWASVSLYLTSCTGFPTDPEMADWLWEDTMAKLAQYRSELQRVGFLVPVREGGRMKLQLKKAPAEKLIVEAYRLQGREAPRGGVTPPMLVKAYKNVGMDVEYVHKKARGDKQVSDEDITEAIESGCSPLDLRGNLKLDEEACLNAGHPLLEAYTFYKQADTLRSKVRRLKKPLMQTWYNTIVETGRTSSSQGDDPSPGQPWTSYGCQIQNLPRAGAEIEEDTK